MVSITGTVWKPIITPALQKAPQSALLMNPSHYSKRESRSSDLYTGVASYPSLFPSDTQGNYRPCRETSLASGKRRSRGCLSPSAAGLRRSERRRGRCGHGRAERRDSRQVRPHGGTPARSRAAPSPPHPGPLCRLAPTAPSRGSAESPNTAAGPGCGGAAAWHGAPRPQPEPFCPPAGPDRRRHAGGPSRGGSAESQPPPRPRSLTHSLTHSFTHLRAGGSAAGAGRAARRARSIAGTALPGPLRGVAAAAALLGGGEEPAGALEARHGLGAAQGAQQAGHAAASSAQRGRSAPRRPRGRGQVRAPRPAQV